MSLQCIVLQILKFYDSKQQNIDVFLLVSGLGSPELSGHFDFFPNGGIDQANCEKSAAQHMLNNEDETEGFLEVVSCSHETSHRHFVNALLNK